MALRIGAGGLGVMGSGWGVLVMTAHHLVGDGDHRLDLALGVSRMGYDDDTGVFAVGELGYRYQPRKGGAFFKLALVPMTLLTSSSGISDDEYCGASPACDPSKRKTRVERDFGDVFVPSIGLSFGYTLSPARRRPRRGGW